MAARLLALGIDCQVTSLRKLQSIMGLCPLYLQYHIYVVISFLSERGGQRIMLPAERGAFNIFTVIIYLDRFVCVYILLVVLVVFIIQ